MPRLLHLSDIHFGCENSQAVAGAHEFAAVGGFDALVVTGDITQMGSQPEFEAAAGWLGSIPGPWICTPGNHDTPYFNLFARLGQPFARYESFAGPAARETLRSERLNVHAINTARGAQVRMNWSKGAIRAADVRRACAALSADGLRVVICHHPLMEVTGGPMTGRVRGGRRASEVLTEAGVDLILTGHVHMPFAHALPFGDGRTYAVGAGTLSLRERGSPAGFNVIEADDTAIKITAMAWTGTGFESRRSWGFDRRTVR